MENFAINKDVLAAIDDYHEKSLLMQAYHFEGNIEGYTIKELEELVNDDLIFNVPIYDMLDRRYAAFSSFLEAIWPGRDDPKGNSEYFADTSKMDEFTWIYLFYLFRLCGSGINYKPKTDEPFGTHGFGNFWVVDCIRQGITDWREWLKILEGLEAPFTNNKGYLLPQFSYPHLKRIGGHLKHYILTTSVHVVDQIESSCQDRTEIIPMVLQTNDLLNLLGFKKQNFVLSATMADIAEYMPHRIDPESMIFAGTNARKCIRAIFKKKGKCSNLEFESQCIQFLADRYGSVPYSVEDSRLCDVVRYFKEYQSSHHVAQNGRRFKNSTTLKTSMGLEAYQEFADNL